MQPSTKANGGLDKGLKEMRKKDKNLRGKTQKWKQNQELEMKFESRI